MTVWRCADLPSTPEEITAEWMTEALSCNYPGLRVTALTMRRVIWGNATKVLVTADYQGSEGTVLPSRHLCVKGAFDARLEGVTAKPLFVLEANFYGELRERFDVPLPGCPYAGLSLDRKLGIVVLEDISVGGARFVDPGETLTVDQVASGLDAQASWHAATWAATPADLPYTRVGNLARVAFPQFLSRTNWEAHFSTEGAPSLPAELSDPDRILAGYRRLWAIDDESVHCLQHGDAHAGNTFIDASGTVGFLDWQTYCLSPWAFDVAYFIGGALEVQTRRASERDLLRHYLKALHAAGGPAMTLDEAWTPYVQHCHHGLTWLVVPEVMQPFERTRTMSRRYVAAALDHDSLGTLGL